MAVEIGSFTTTSSTGTRNLTLPTVPNPSFISFSVGAKSGVSNIMQCDGGWDGTTNYCQGVFANGTVIKKFDSTSKVISIYDLSGGVATLVYEMSVISATGGTLSLNITTSSAAGAGYHIFLEANA